MLIVALSLASGVASGLLSEDGTMHWLPGVLFALAVIGGSYTRFEKVGLLRMLLIAGTSIFANYCAVSCAIALEDHAGPTTVGAIAGLVGGALLGLGLPIAYRLRPISRTMLILAAAGAALGTAFFAIEDLRVSYAIWQGGMGAAIAYCWQRKRS